MDTDLELLGYSPKWVEYGYLTPEFLRAQVEWFHSGHDRSTEHYRYSAFKHLQRRAAFSASEFDRYLELATLDPDPAMGTAAIIDLIHHPGLTEAQYEAIMAHPRLQALPRLVKKQRLLRALRAPEVTEETLQRYFIPRLRPEHRQAAASNPPIAPLPEPLSVPRYDRIGS